MWGAGAIWNITRWMSIFLGSYLVDKLTSSPFRVQLVGVAFYLPMFLGGLLAGMISDRFDRRRTVLRQMVLLAPIAGIMAALVWSDHVQVWMIYINMLVVGIGGVVDMTNRRALVYDMVGEKLITNAMALESMSMSVGNMLGALTGGTVIGLLGLGQAYAVIAGLFVACFLLMRPVPAPPRRGLAAAPASIKADLTSAIRSLPDNRPLVSLLGVTFAMNFLFFSYMPLIPVFARTFHAGPILTGLLASGSGVGMMLGSLLVARVNPHRRGVVYVGGSFLAMAVIIVFANMHLYPLALVTLIVMGICSAGFGSTQSALVMSVTSDDMRGRAMGLLSMTIGALPFGMFALGVVAERVGPATAVVISSTIGIVGLALWLVRYPEIIKIR